jgi:hypothetical protein
MVRKAIGTLYSLPTNSNPTEKPTMPKPTSKPIKYTGIKSQAQIQKEIDSGLAPFETMDEAKAYYDKLSIDIN